MKLHDLQKQFMNVIKPSSMQKARGGAEADVFICEAMKLPQRQDPELCLQIYCDSSLGGRLKALRNIFHSCERMVGEPFFAQMTTEFLTQHASQHLTADAQGQYFPDFIANYSAAFTVPYLSDLAQLEWLWYQVFHGASETPRFMQSDYLVTQLWEMCQPEYCGDFVLQDLSESLKVMLIQREQRIHMSHLTQEEWETWQ